MKVRRLNVIDRQFVADELNEGLKMTLVPLKRTWRLVFVRPMQELVNELR